MHLCYSNNNNNSECFRVSVVVALLYHCVCVYAMCVCVLNSHRPITKHLLFYYSTVICSLHSQPTTYLYMLFYALSLSHNFLPQGGGHCIAIERTNTWYFPFFPLLSLFPPNKVFPCFFLIGKIVLCFLMSLSFVLT